MGSNWTCKIKRNIYVIRLLKKILKNKMTIYTQTSFAKSNQLIKIEFQNFSKVSKRNFVDFKMIMSSQLDKVLIPTIKKINIKSNFLKTLHTFAAFNFSALFDAYYYLEYLAI